jgi:hypothetical protein
MAVLLQTAACLAALTTAPMTASRPFAAALSHSHSASRQLFLPVRRQQVAVRMLEESAGVHAPRGVPRRASLQMDGRRGGKNDDDDESALLKLWDVTSIVWNFIINTAGATVAAGLILNICGFGYRLTVVPPTVVIKPLAEMRQENAWKRMWAKAHDPNLFSQVEANALASKP